MWGLDMLAYSPRWVEVAFLVLGGSLLILGFHGAAAKQVGELSSRPRIWLSLLLLVSAGLALFVGLRSAVHLLGDGDLVLRELAKQISRTGNEPLALWMFGAIYLKVVAFGSSEVVYRTNSYVAGVLYLIMAFVAVRRLGRDRMQRLVVLAFLLTPGYLQLFCGYVENYALLFPGTLLYLHGGLQYLRGRLPLWLVSSALAVLMVYHFIAVTLAPSLLALFATFMTPSRWVPHPTMVSSGLASRVMSRPFDQRRIQRRGPAKREIFCLDKLIF